MYHSQVVLGLGLSMKFSNFSNSYFMLWKMGYFMNYKYWIFAFLFLSTIGVNICFYLFS